MTDVNIRKARREDCQEIMRLIKELAEFERMAHLVYLDVKTLERDGFDSEIPPFYCLVVEDPEHANVSPPKLIGYALYSLVYGTWEGKRYWLEDIMITEKYRGRGLGYKLFSALCKEAVKEGIVSIKFTVLEWNPANEFYKKLGAVNQTKTEEWQYTKVDHKGIMKWANYS